MPSKKALKPDTFFLRTVELISDPRFVHFENLIREPNIFQIIGRSHYERWHSALWGWLLDPTGSHLLQHYALVRLLYLLFHGDVVKPTKNDLNKMAHLLSVAKFSNFEVIPNERNSTEVGITGVGRFDVFITGEFESSTGVKGRLNLLLELKIETGAKAEQSKRYADWLQNNRPNDYNFLIYFLPELSKTAKETVGDDRWFGVSYQTLHNELLVPLLAHPNLNDKVRPFIVQYVKNLRIPRRGIKMAITQEEKQAAVALYERYNEVFDAIFDALVANGTLDQSTSDLEPRGRSAGRIAVRINKKVFSDSTVRLLFEQVLKYLVDANILKSLPMPWGTSTKRFIITNSTPVHPNGRSFFYPVQYKGYTLESHYSRDRAIEVLSALCEKLELNFERIKC
jgi:hypothetical protein